MLDDCDDDPLWYDYKDEIDVPNHYRYCPECGGSLILRNGKYGQFYGCENFPKCRFSCDVEEFDGE